jgi:hypothetical protein
MGCTDNITFIVQFDGSDQLGQFHQDEFYNKIPYNIGRKKLPSVKVDDEEDSNAPPSEEGPGHIGSDDGNVPEMTNNDDTMI